ncbi:MAG TPA: hypothetical protein VGR57_16720, partial [Ktedonobacterales bacterium]|nr:hypothetical protein [Ktedonobacterales bacterium]
VIGALLSTGVVLTNVVFPSPNESDNEYTSWYVVAYLALFALFGVGGIIASRRANPARTGAVGGAVTALIVVGMTLLTFVVVDNVFLSIVSQQVDKISAFHNQTTYTNMRDFINSGLLLGLPIALGFGALMGGALGAAGGVARFRFARAAAAD